MVSIYKIVWKQNMLSLQSVTNNILPQIYTKFWRIVYTYEQSLNIFFLKNHLIRTTSDTSVPLGLKLNEMLLSLV